jgi:hypothetical protein
VKMLLVCNPAAAFGQVLAASPNPGPFTLAYQRTDHRHVVVTADYKQEEPQTCNNLRHQLLYEALLIFSCNGHSLFGYCIDSAPSDGKDYNTCLLSKTSNIISS